LRGSDRRVNDGISVSVRTQVIDLSWIIKMTRRTMPVCTTEREERGNKDGAKELYLGSRKRLN